MSQSIIDSYLIALKFSPDQPSLANFQRSLSMAEGAVASTAGSIGAHMLTAQVAVTGAFAAMGFGAIGYIEKLAMSDQQSRLFAQRSFMTVNQAKSVKAALDTLGVSLEDVAWNDELRGRFKSLYDQNMNLNNLLGPQYEKQMLQIRDVRFELGKLETSAQGFGQLVVSDVLKKLGFGDDTAAQLDRFNEYVMTNLPKWSDGFSTKLVPSIREAGKIAGRTFDVMKEGLGIFQELTGLLTGDTSLQNTNVSFHSIGRSLEYAVHYLGEFLKSITTLEMAGGKGIESVVLRFQSLSDTLHGDFKGGQAKLEQSDKLMMESGAIISKANTESLTGGRWRPEDDAVMDFIKKSGMSMSAQDIGSVPKAMGGGATLPASILKAIKHVAEGTHLHEDLMYAQAAFETGGFTSRQFRELNNLSGIKIPGTNIFKKFGSIDEWADAQIRVLSNPRYMDNGLLAATNGAEFAHALHAPGYSYFGTDSERNYGLGIESRRREFQEGVSVGTINVHITQPNAHGPEIQAAVTKGVRDGLAQRTQQDIVQTSGAF